MYIGEKVKQFYSKHKKKIIIAFIIVVFCFTYITSPFTRSEAYFTDVDNIQEGLLKKHYCKNLFQELWNEFKYRNENFKCPQSK
ncbi:MAG: hypothetical protein CL565_00740 [Alphaproteobacteria bacterium]|nr:hypothetical protein [Alphaproteobacteria bacterium]